MTMIDGDDTVIQSSILGTPCELNLKHLCQILKLSNEGDHCYLTTHDNLPGRTEKEVIMLSPTLDESQYLYSFETQLPCYFKVVYREHCRS